MSDTMHQARSEAGDAARSVGTTAKERASDVATTAGDEVRTVAQDARSQAQHVINQSRDQLRTQASEQTTRLAGTLRDVAEQMRGMARGEAPSEGPVANMTSSIADTVSRVASRLENGGVDGAMSDVKRYARNHPGMFLAGALGAGFLIGRVVKSVDTRAIADAAKGEGRDDDMVSGYGTQRGITATTPSSALGAQTPPPPPPPAYTPTTPSPYATGDIGSTTEIP